MLMLLAAHSVWPKVLALVIVLALVMGLGLLGSKITPNDSGGNDG